MRLGVDQINGCLHKTATAFAIHKAGILTKRTIIWRCQIIQRISMLLDKSFTLLADIA